MSDPSHVDHGPSSAAPLSLTRALAHQPCDSPSPCPPTGATAPGAAEHGVPCASALAPPADGGVADDATGSAIPPSSTASSHTPSSRGTGVPPFPSVLDPSMPAQSQSGPAVLPGQASDEPLTSLGTDPGASADPMSSRHKRPRPPVLEQRQQTSSLLTQALATARGIPSQTSAVPSTASTSATSSTHTGPQTTPSCATNHVPPRTGSRLPYHLANHSTTSHSTDTALSTAPSSLFKDDGSRPADVDDGPLTSKAAATSSTAASPDTGSLAPATPASSSLPSSHTMSAIGVTSPAPAQHHIFPSNGACEPSPLERIERDVWALERQRLTRTYTQPPNLERPSEPTVVGSPEKIHATMPYAQGFAGEEQQRARPGTKLPEPRYSIGPEKMWSIGSGELGDAQDGQVEKSIAKAMAREEHNNRSRKSSHTLGFFREGLPEDRARRKGSKGTVQAQPGSIAERAGRARAKSDVIVEDTAELRDTPRPPEHGPMKETTPAISRRPTPPPERPSQSDELANTTSSTGGPRQEAPASLQPPSPAPSSDGSATLAAGGNSPVNRPRSSASSKEGGRHDEGDDSGEEKISSAFFMPHQDPERAMGEECATPSELEPPPCHAQPRGQDRSPWLVKADEPEPEDHTPPPTPPSPKSRRDERHPSFTGSRETGIVCKEVAIVDVAEETLPSSAKTVSHPTLLYHDNYRAQEGDQKSAKQPLEAIELIPYNHQVGGHTPLWRFSKRAVCKKLNNRENAFYETVEHFHRDLLRFLPRYIGVLNVTFQKLPRRKSTSKKGDAGSGKGPLLDVPASKSPLGDADAPADQAQHGTGRKRVVSQSISNAPAQIPTVTFDDNRHIIPRNLLQPDLPPAPPVYHRARRPSGLEAAGMNGDSAAWTQGHPGAVKSWGATIVNKRLRNEVFNNAFFEHPVSIQRHRKPHRRPLVPRPAAPHQPPLKTAQSDSRLVGLDNPSNEDPAVLTTSTPPPAIQVPSRARLTDRPNQLLPDVHGHEDGEIKDVTGTSAPEPETLGEEMLSQKRTRRYSGSGLRRKPQVGSESRGDLKYFEEADQVHFKDGKGPSTPFARSNGIEPSLPVEGLVEPGDQAVDDKFALPPPVDFKIPRPVNPKEAQTQRDSRVEYFLLLEDLTAGMKRPCIMDLKMGTRQYGIDATPAKRQSQMGKCAKTTSRELGVRVCGLQVWDVKTQSYIFRDKYEGRKIKAGIEFQQALTRFLYNGVDYHSILRQIPTIIRKLDELTRIARGLRGYRFYAASLLMFYDGEEADADVVDDSTTDAATDAEDMPVRKRRRNKREVNFKIADFANSITARTPVADKACPPTYPEEPDRGFLRGLATLRKYFLRIQRDVRAEAGIEVRGRMEDVEEEEGFVSE